MAANANASMTSEIAKPAVNKIKFTHDDYDLNNISLVLRKRILYTSSSSHVST